MATYVLNLERIGDLLLSVANRLETVLSRLESQDLRDLAGMATIVCGMLGGCYGMRSHDET